MNLRDKLENMGFLLIGQGNYKTKNYMIKKMFKNRKHHFIFFKIDDNKKYFLGESKEINIINKTDTLNQMYDYIKKFNLCVE